jgi:hypothetical protein
MIERKSLIYKKVDAIIDIFPSDATFFIFMHLPLQGLDLITFHIHCKWVIHRKTPDGVNPTYIPDGSSGMFFYRMDLRIPLPANFHRSLEAILSSNFKILGTILIYFRRIAYVKINLL